MKWHAGRRRAKGLKGPDDMVCVVTIVLTAAMFLWDRLAAVPPTKEQLEREAYRAKSEPKKKFEVPAEWKD